MLPGRARPDDAVAAHEVRALKKRRELELRVAAVVVGRLVLEVDEDAQVRARHRRVRARPDDDAAVADVHGFVVDGRQDDVALENRRRAGRDDDRRRSHVRVRRDLDLDAVREPHEEGVAQAPRLAAADDDAAVARGELARPRRRREDAVAEDLRRGRRWRGER